MSNRRYYERRAASQCPDCGVSVSDGVYCSTHRAARRQRVVADQSSDRAGYNLYMRVYKAQRKSAERGA